jgi:hypothetical protein
MNNIPKVIRICEVIKGHAYVLALCSCGNVFRTWRTNLNSGTTKSCGCLRRKVMKFRDRTHGDTKSIEYRTWANMMYRCYNPRAEKYPNYGGRGIGVAVRWHKYENFLADMGRRPADKSSLDRFDNDGWYTYSNCRWSTAKQQANNRRNPICK